MHVCMYACAYVRTYTHVFVCVCVYLYIYIYVYYLNFVPRCQLCHISSVSFVVVVCVRNSMKCERVCACVCLFASPSVCLCATLADMAKYFCQLCCCKAQMRCGYASSWRN